MVDMRMLPRIAEGEVRFLMIEATLYAIEVYVYSAGVMGETMCTMYKPDAPEFAELRAQFDAKLPAMMKLLGLRGEPLPLIWTADFIAVDNHTSAFALSEINCSCV